MSPEDSSLKLYSLTSRQREILQLFCEGNNYKQIAETLVISENTVKSHMGHIYVKLGLDMLDDAQRKKTLHQGFCAALGAIDVAPPKPDEPKELAPIPEYVWKMVEEDEKAIMIRPSTQIIDITPKPDPKQKPKPTKRFRWFLFGVVVGMILMAIVVYYSWKANLLLSPESEIPAITTENQNPITTVEQSVNPETDVTQIQNQPAITENQITEESEVIKTEAAILPSPTPMYKVLFEDNFDMGLSPLWQIISGKPSIVNGALTTDSEIWLMAGDDSWVNYIVEYETKIEHCFISRAYNILGLYAKDPSNMVAFKYADCEGEWHTVTNGTDKAIPNAVYEGPNIGKQHPMKFSTQNSSFSVTIREDIVSFFDQSFTSGGVVIRLSEKSIIDNFRVITLP